MTTRPTTPRRAWRPGTIIFAALTVFAVAVEFVVLYALGIIEFGTPGYIGPGSSDTTRITVRGEHVAFVLKAPESTGITRIGVGHDDECDRVVYYLNTGGLVVEAVSMTCEPDGEQIINGHHGTYRTMDDVPEPKNVEDVETPLGPAMVFTQDYVEYTNESTSYEEPVAIVTVDDPVDANYPTLVVRSERGELGRDAFTEIVDSLSEPA